VGSGSTSPLAVGSLAGLGILEFIAGTPPLRGKPSGYYPDRLPLSVMIAICSATPPFNVRTKAFERNSLLFYGSHLFVQCLVWCAPSNDSSWRAVEGLGYSRPAAASTSSGTYFATTATRNQCWGCPQIVDSWSGGLCRLRFCCGEESFVFHGCGVAQC
jgi:hypothetical protein